MLNAISPVDGRYADKTAPLQGYFSEFALIKYRVDVEVRYFTALCKLPLKQLKGVTDEQLAALSDITTGFTPEQAERVKAIEKQTNHDVKAVEYFLKEAFDRLEMTQYREFIHFGLTSQDINNTATPALLRDALEDVFYPVFLDLIKTLESLAEKWKTIPMLARTHGQPASPTLLGKEIEVFQARLLEQLRQLKIVPIRAKFGGATGGMNAHFAAYPDIDWHRFATGFVLSLGLERAYPTTQIEHYDNLAAVFHAQSRINTILIDLCRDIWTYISMDYFKQKVVAGEVGSSAMPHKVNPIDFENAEGNLGIANALFEHLAAKLPVSRLQRDLTDSTVLRNVGVPYAHTLIALLSLKKGLSKIVLNEPALRNDLENNWMVVTEAIQTVLRRENYPEPYEALKQLSRGNSSLGEQQIREFIESLDVRPEVREELLAFKPWNYTGR